METITLETMAALFRAADAAVIGTKGSRVVFANPAAVLALGQDPTGQRASSILPERLTQLQSSLGAASARIRGRNAVITLTGAGLLRVYTIRFDPPVRRMPPLPTPQMSVLANLRMAAEMLRVKGMVTQAGAAHAAQILKSYYQLQRWVTNVNTLAALQEGTLPFLPENTDCAALLRHAAEELGPMAERRGIQIFAEVPEAAAVAAADTVLLERMLMNLLSNSLLHCESGCRIRLGLAVTEQQLTITVHDTGGGIPPERVGSIFTSYDLYTGCDRQGAGCGLPVALGIIRLHGGELLIDTTPGLGTTVLVTLPRNQKTTLTLRSDPAEYRSKDRTGLFVSMADVLEPEEFL